MSTTADVLIVGAGAAGLFCAGVAAQRGLHVVLLDHADKVAEKIRISGGGRSNFTNRDLDVRQPHRHYLGENPAFSRSALSRYTPADFIALMQQHRVPFHEKHKGQLFCDRSSQDLIDLLLHECQSGAAGGRVDHWQPCGLKGLRYHDQADAFYEADTDRGSVRAWAVVVATGGLSIPQIGATDLGYRLARQFNLDLVPTRPALVPLTFDAATWSPMAALAGLSLPVDIGLGPASSTQLPKRQRSAAALPHFDEDLLFTHRGLSGPAVLQISSYWQPGQDLRINLSPGTDLAAELKRLKLSSRRRLANELTQWFPSRLADLWTQGQPVWQRPLPDIPDRALDDLAQQLTGWSLKPSGTEGYRKAEVTAGGVSTRALSQQTLESRQPGLYFIGEVVDITGWLGGYNFQWAWSSAHACAQALAASLKGL
jgi:predicted Rossmann fold flavoprotein